MATKTMSDAEPEVARAIEWMLLLRSGQADPEAMMGHRAWRQAHPAHEMAWKRVSHALGAFETLRQRGVPGAVVQRTMANASRRHALSAAFSLAGLGVTGGGAGALGWQVAQQQGLLADRSTGVAQRHQETLPGGGSLWLDARTAVDVASIDGQPQLVLHQGRMLVSTAAGRSAGPRRVPADAGLRRVSMDAGLLRVSTDAGLRRESTDTSLLRVRTAAGLLTASDAQFVVQGGRDRPLQVATLSGSVTVTSTSGERQHVREGQRLMAVPGEPMRLATARGTESLWTRGLISMDNEPLGDLVEVLQGYRSGVLRVDPRAARLRISGVFSLDDTDRTLRALAETQPIRIATRSRYWVSIELV
jgi:transmembrane sensor